MSDEDTLRQHSVAYNSFLWKLAVALGMAKANEPSAVPQPEEVQEKAIKQLVHLGSLSATRAEHIELLQDQIERTQSDLAASRANAHPAAEMASRYAARASRSEALLVSALATLRSVRADRPSAHSDAVWGAVNTVIEEIEGFQFETPVAVS